MDRDTIEITLPLKAFVSITFDVEPGTILTDKLIEEHIHLINVSLQDDAQVIEQCTRLWVSLSPDIDPLAAAPTSYCGGNDWTLTKGQPVTKPD